MKKQGQNGLEKNEKSQWAMPFRCYLLKVVNPEFKIVSAIPPKEWLLLYPTHLECGDEFLLDKLKKIVDKPNLPLF
jgi:hypothetical protein